MQVFASGQLIGTIKEEWAFCKRRFVIKDASGSIVIKIKGPICPISCGKDVDFVVLTVDEGQIVGKISKQWSGLVRETFTDIDYFGVSFPINFDVKIKALLLAACFLIVRILFTFIVFIFHIKAICFHVFFFFCRIIFILNYNQVKDDDNLRMAIFD